MGAEVVIRSFPAKLRKLLEPLKISHLEEVRLRADQPLMVVWNGKDYFVTDQGQLSMDQSQSWKVPESLLREAVETFSSHSLYAYEEELRQGFFTIQGGHRIGVAGKVVLEHGAVKTMKYLSFLNVRIAHEIRGCADGILPYIYEADRCEINREIFHTLLISPPRCGKTTLLRDLIRQISNGNAFHPGMTVGVVDERSEIGGSYQGIPQNDVGIRTDVLDCCSKAEGMVMLLRSMAPQVIAVDEIGNYEDIRAIEMTLNSGCKLLATVHGSSIDEIRKKPLLERLMKEHVFERYIILQKETAGQIGKVQEIYDERGTCLYQRQRSVC